ncbi:MAG: cyanophycinase [Crocinitomicaceae bacterium]|nr:cyanophycinase [Crocinitomicaceae bacterium]
MTHVKFIKGTLFPIGGNEDKHIEDNELYTQDFIEDGILSHVVREAGGTDAKIVVIPTASSIPVEVGENYLHAFDHLGCKKVKVLQIKNRIHAGNNDYMKAIEEADCIMFGGGDQSKIVAAIGSTRMHQLILDKYYNTPLVIAGTSAGAMCMSHEMIAGGSSTDALAKGSVRLDKGMGFIPQTIIDSHFIQRARFGRLAEAVAAFPNLIGIGLAEDTGVIIKEARHMKVVGSGMVVLFDGHGLTHNNHAILKMGTPMSMTDLKVHILANGDRYDLETRQVSVLPMASKFE